MRHRTDHNQAEIVKALEAIGCTVYKMGRPVDLLVGYRSLNFVMDVKSRTGKNTPFQDKFFREWKGQVRIVRSPEEAIQLVTGSYTNQG